MVADQDDDKAVAADRAVITAVAVDISVRSRRNSAKHIIGVAKLCRRRPSRTRFRHSLARRKHRGSELAPLAVRSCFSRRAAQSSKAIG